MTGRPVHVRQLAARTLRAEGLSYQAIGDQLGVSETTARRWCDARLHGEGGICECGCGGRTKIAPVTTPTATRGQPFRFIAGHQHRHYEDDYIEEDRGYLTPCWIWQRGLVEPGSYGAISREGYQGVAHRWYYERLISPVPEGLELDHLCRVRICVNPAHLEPVTRTENIRRGAATKLTLADVEAIRASAEAPMVLARRYGVTGTHIHTILNRKQWRDAA